MVVIDPDIVYSFTLKSKFTNWLLNNFKLVILFFFLLTLLDDNLAGKRTPYTSAISALSSLSAFFRFVRHFCHRKFWKSNCCFMEVQWTLLGQNQTYKTTHIKELNWFKRWCFFISSFSMAQTFFIFYCSFFRQKRRWATLDWLVMRNSLQEWTRMCLLVLKWPWNYSSKDWNQWKR